MHLGEVGEAALGERAQQVQRRRRLVVALQHAGRVEGTRGGVRLVAVHHVTAEAGQLDSVHQLGRRRPRLHELAGDPAQLDHRQHRAVREHGRHLQDHLQLLADADGREVVERLGAVARLQQEGAPGRHLRQRLLQPPGLAGEHQRRHRGEPLARRLDGGRVGPVRLMERRTLAPGGRRPGWLGGCHGTFSLLGWVGLPIHGTRLLGHPADRHQAPRQLHRRHPPLRRRPGHGRRLLLRRRPARDLGALRAGGAAREHAGHGRHPAGGRSRSGPLHAVRAEPRGRPRLRRLAAGRVATMGELRRHDPVQGEEHRPDSVSADLFTYPVLQAADILLYQRRPRPGGRRPAPAPGACPEHRAAIQLAVSASCSRCRRRPSPPAATA